MQIKIIARSRNLFNYYLGRAGEGPSLTAEESMYKLILGVAALALSAGTASAQWVYPGYGYAPYGYGYAGLYDYAAPAYGYAAPAYAPATAGTTVVIVTPGSGYTAPPVASGYYGAPVVSQPIHPGIGTEATGAVGAAMAGGNSASN